MNGEVKHEENPILHIFVVGFHHKRGCQVEFCYPPISENTDCGIRDGDLPLPWQHLPTLALPDGAHNVDKDFVFFLLPSAEDPTKSIFGVSCFQQVSAKELLCKGDDVTRSTVQKSVCVLSKLPLFGSLKAKLELITQAYFNEKNFAKVEVLAEMYLNLKATFTSDIIPTQALLGIVEKGLYEACIYIEDEKKSCESDTCPSQSISSNLDSSSEDIKMNTEEKETSSETPSRPLDLGEPIIDGDGSLLQEIEKELEEPKTPSTPTEIILDSTYSAVSNIGARISTFWSGTASTSITPGDEEAKGIEVGSEAMEAEPVVETNLETDAWGFPLSIFTHGSLCFPYLSLGYLDALNSKIARSYIFGATNALFKQRKNLVDVIVTADENGEIDLEIIDVDLKKQLALTTADLRFSDFIAKHVTPDTGNVFIDATGWEGGNEWIRLQFRAYLLSLVASAQQSELSIKHDFNPAFIQEWKNSRNYKVWTTGSYSELKNAVPGHPFAGQMGVSDVKLRISHSVNSTNQGRKLAKAAVDTGKYVSMTGKAVKSRLSGFFWTDVPPSQSPSIDQISTSDNEKHEPYPS